MQTNKQSRQLLDVAEDTANFLQEVLDAFYVLRADMERSGYQREEHFDKLKAMLFARQFPLYLSAFNVIVSELNRQIEKLETAVKAEYEARKSEKVTA